jgi:hypothetical protein
MAINFNLLLSVPETAADLKEKLRLELNDDPKARLNALAQYLVAAAAGLGSASVRAQVAAVKASGTVTCASVLAADTVTINGVVLTAVNGSPAADQFDMSGNATAEAVSLVSAINANATLAGLVLASNVAGVVTVEALNGGLSGNAITLESSNGTRLAVSAARLAGGTNGTAYSYSVGQ